MSSTNYPAVFVKADRLAAIERFHPWIFSKGIKRKDPVRDGDLVQVMGPSGQYLATGHYHDAAIAVRILSYKDIPINQDFWIAAINRCRDRRKTLNLPNAHTTAYRLVHGEGDNLSGLIIDIYDKTAVIQCHTVGMYQSMQQIAAALKQVFGPQTLVYNKSGNTLPASFHPEIKDGFIIGKSEHLTVKENGHLFHIDLIEGQKTGFFLDQRDNRQLLSSFSANKKILNLYCYTGGFSIYALNTGAKYVCSVDASAKAISLLEENIKLNDIDPEKHLSITGDVKNVLKEIPRYSYDIIVVDPPAFAKSQYKSHNAVQAYKRINAMAMDKVNQGGLIFTFSCSQVIDQVLFQNTITAAAIESGRDIRILYTLSQGPDHPVNIFHPEGKYLKGLVLQVE